VYVGTLPSAFALRFDGRNRKRDAEIMSRIAAKRRFPHLAAKRSEVPTPMGLPDRPYSVRIRCYFTSCVAGKSSSRLRCPAQSASAYAPLGVFRPCLFSASVSPWCYSTQGPNADRCCNALRRLVIAGPDLGSDSYVERPDRQGVCGGSDPFEAVQSYVRPTDAGM